MYIDSHCHIDIYSDEEIEKIIERARKADVRIIINNGIDIKTNRRTLELAGKYPEVKVALGIYPVDCLKLSDEEIDGEIEFIRKNKKNIVAIGEVGLDLKENLDLEKQKINFEKFILLAKELDKPIIVHSRKAEKECIELLEEHKMKKVVMHCFFGKLNLVERIIKNGWSFSIPAIVKGNLAMQELAKKVPLKNMLLETDSPFLHPDGKINNEPAFVVEGYKKIGELKKLSGNFSLSKSENINPDLKIKNLKLEEVEDAILSNYKSIFGRI